MYERFTDRARKIMQLANQEAQRMNHGYIGTEHVLIGLCKCNPGIGRTALENLKVCPIKVMKAVRDIVLDGPDFVTMGKLPQTPRTKRVVEYAITTAQELGHNYVGSEHILLGLLREQEGVAAQVLMNMGLKYDAVKEEILNILGAARPQLPPMMPSSPYPPDVSNMVGQLQELAKSYPKLYADLCRALAEIHQKKEGKMLKDTGMPLTDGIVDHKPLPIWSARKSDTPVCTCKSLLGQRDPDCPVHRGK